MAMNKRELRCLLTRLMALDKPELVEAILEIEENMEDGNHGDEPGSANEHNESDD